MWISYKFTYVPSLLSLPPTTRPCHPSRSSQSTKLWCKAPSVVQRLPSRYFIHGRVYNSIYSLNSSHLLLAPTVSTNPFFTSVSLFSQSWSRGWLFVIPWTVAQQAPLSMELSRQEYWSVLSFPSPMSLFLPCKQVHQYHFSRFHL